MSSLIVREYFEFLKKVHINFCFKRDLVHWTYLQAQQQL